MNFTTGNMASYLRASNEKRAGVAFSFTSLILCLFLFGPQLTTAQEMGGPPKKAKKVTKSDINSEKRAYSSLQKAYQDKTVFSNTHIDKTNGTKDQLIKTWNMEDPLFYRVYHNLTIMEAVLEYNEKTKTKFNQYDYAKFTTGVVIYIDGKEMATREVEFGSKDAVTMWTAHSGYVYTPTKPGKGSEGMGLAIRRAFHALGDDYKPGTFDLKIEIYAFDYALDDTRVKRDKSQRVMKISEGELKVEVTQKGMENFAPFMCYPILKQNGDLVDDGLEDMVMVEFSKEYGKATEANIVNEDWAIKKNNYGTPLRRLLSTKVSYIDKKGNSNIIDYYINQPYDGSGGYQNIVRTSSVGESRPFSPFCISYKQGL